MRRLALVPTLIAALLLPSGAHALGLGEIAVQSALNQPLDAEIPLRGVPSGQGDEIEVSLASEEAFEDVGLDRPFALTRLQFEVKEGEGGDYYVHVTSEKSIVEPYLSFLVEVDWEGGNLLREYTVLLDPPVYTSEEEESGADADTTDTARTSESDDDSGVTGEIERDDEASATDESGDGEDAGGTSGSGQSAAGADEEKDGEKPVFLEVEEREERAERARAEEEGTGGSDEGGSADTPEQYGPVGDGDTLWSIANRLKSGDMTTHQMMVALLRYNPDAFGGENVNRLKKGYVLRVPDSDRVLEVSAQRALAEVREQNGVWQKLKEGSSSETSVAASEQGSGEAGASGESASGSDDAELSIVGADEGGASSDEAASATGSRSEDESEELQLAREELESTRAEKEELESRVTELEETVAKMEKLLNVRDERLSALQDELRELEDGEDPDASDEDTASEDDAETDVAEAEDAEAEDAGDEESDETGSSDGDASAESDEDADDGEEVATADGDTGEDEESGATGDDGSDGDGASAEDDGETTDGETGTADAEDADESESTETTASADEEADGDYVPEDKRATEEDRGFETTRTRDPEETWLDQVNNAIAAVTGFFGGIFAGGGGGILEGPVGLGLAAAVILLGGGLILMRRRREAAASAALDDFDPVDADADMAPFDADASGRFETEAPRDDERAGARAASAEDAQSALMAEEFDMASLDDEEESAGHAQSDAVAEPAHGIDDEEAEKDDTVAEADVYLAYGLHQQAEDLLRLALREQPGNLMYQEKLLETLYASGRTDDFIEEAERYRDLVDGPQSRGWQRVLAMGRDLAPRHELFAEGDTEYTAADLQPTRPAGTDLELDDADGEIDFGLDDEPESSAGGAGGGQRDEDEFGSTVMLDSADFEAVDGDGGLTGPDEDATRDTVSDASPVGDAEGTREDEDDLEFDLGDLEGLTGESDARATSVASPKPDTDEPDDIDFDLDDDTGQTPEQTPEQAPGHGDGTVAGTDEGALDFDLDFGEPEPRDEESGGGESTDSPQPEVAADATDYEDGLDFDFDFEESASEPSPASTDTADDAGVAEPVAGDDDEPLEIGDLEIGDLDSLETDTATDSAEDAERPEERASATGSGSEADAFDLSDLDEGPEEAPADRAAPEPATGDANVDTDDAFDLSDLDAAGGPEEDDDGAFNLDDLGAAAGTDTPEPAGGAPEPEMEAGDSGRTGDAGAATGTEGTSDEDDDFDTMLDLARAYIDMGDPESATNALEEVASSGNEQQRSEAQSLLDSVR
ncbi:MAG: FimV/HubP family polar landmark protein [Halofilum sp. (in: g-proteobacteria)]